MSTTYGVRCLEKPQYVLVAIDQKGAKYLRGSVTTFFSCAENFSD